MPEKPTRRLPTHAEIGGEVERLRVKIRQTCSEMQRDEFEIAGGGCRVTRGHRQRRRGARQGLSRSEAALVGGPLSIRIRSEVNGRVRHRAIRVDHAPGAPSPPAGQCPLASIDALRNTPAARAVRFACNGGTHGYRNTRDSRSNWER